MNAAPFPYIGKMLVQEARRVHPGALQPTSHLVSRAVAMA